MMCYMGVDAGARNDGDRRGRVVAARVLFAHMYVYVARVVGGVQNTRV